MSYYDIRRYDINDPVDGDRYVKDIQELDALFLADPGSAFPFRDEDMPVDREFLQDKFIWLAYDDINVANKHALGMLIASRNDYAKYYSTYAFYVRPHVRGTRIGISLFQQLSDLAESEHYGLEHCVLLDNYIAKHIYAKFGMKPYAELLYRKWNWEAQND
jgi:GNAT superfamily N-acetyltransferase